MRCTPWFAVALAGCVPSRSTLFDPVGAEVQRRVGVSVTWTEDARTTPAIDALLAKPVDAETAVRIALARNRRLQASFDELGIAASQVAEATVLPPLSVDVDHKFSSNKDASETEVEAVQDVLDLFQIGQRRAAARGELAAARARAIAAAVRIASDVEQAFDDLLAAQQDEELVRTAFQAAQASADLVERQHAAGNTSDLALEREREQAERMRVEMMRAGLVVSERRARLAVLLGVGQQRAIAAAGRFPDLPEEPPNLDDLESVAAAASLERSALADEAAAANARLRYATVRAFLPELGVGISAAQREGLPWAEGPAIRFGLPLFNQQQAARARASAEEKRARDEAAAVSSELAANVQAARSRAVVAFAEARQLRDVVMPMRERILSETVLQYNAMNASTFELLTARRDMVDVGRQYIDTLRRFWRAMAEVKALRRGAGHSLSEEMP
jgi:cobalt-zinc-cadmium efflux system outer membrane protein